MRLKIQCTYVLPIWHVHCRWYTFRQNSADIEFGQSGWLARRRGSENLHWKSGPFAILGLRKLQPAASSRETATRCRFKSIQNSKIVRCRRPLSVILKNAVLAIGLTVRDMLHKQNKAAFYALVNRGRPRGRPLSNKPKALWYNVYNAVIPIEHASTEASQWLGKKSRVIFGTSLWGLICYQLFCALALGPCPSPLCKIWRSETHV